MTSSDARKSLEMKMKELPKNDQLEVTKKDVSKYLSHSVTTENTHYSFTQSGKVCAVGKYLTDLRSQVSEPSYSALPVTR